MCSPSPCREGAGGWVHATRTQRTSGESHTRCHRRTRVLIDRRLVDLRRFRSTSARAAAERLRCLRLATAVAYSGPGFTLDTRLGGSCNCEVIEFVPHCNGTHTESVGHITRERFPLSAVHIPLFLSCLVVSVTPKGREIHSAEGVFERAIREHPIAAGAEFLEAGSIVRTRPNDGE